MDERLYKSEDGVKVSIVIPVYNVSEYIERCLKSVMRQTYMNIECIIVDDVSPDDSIIQCENLIAGYRGPMQFFIIHHKQNRGLSAARNSGTEIAKGEFVYYLDSDDEIKEDCIELLVNEVSKHPSVELVQGEIESIPFDPFYSMNFLQDIDYITDNLWFRDRFYRPNCYFPVNAWNKLIRLDFIRKHSLTFREGLIHEDQLWMFYVAKFLSKVAIVHKPTYIHYCGTKGSIMTTTQKSREAKNWALILKEVLEYLDAPHYQSQLLTYSYHVVYYFGRSKEDLTTYSILLKRFCGRLWKEHFYLVSSLMLSMYLLYPILKGKGRSILLNRISLQRENII